MDKSKDVKIVHVGSRCLLQIRAESIEISSYRIQGTDEGGTSITVTIDGEVSELALEASLAVRK